MKKLGKKTPNPVNVEKFQAGNAVKFSFSKKKGK